LGMTRKEIDEKFGEIVEFADIGEFIDAPVNTYSSGMRVRLGFSIAVHGNPDILLVDEILSVGDLSFRNKSMRKMAEFREKANALIFISHNLGQVRNLCNRVIVLDHGKILFEGDTHEALVFYEEISRSQRVHQNNKRLFKIYQKDDDMINVLNFGILSKNGLETDNIGLDEPLIAFIDFEIKKYIEEMTISFSLLTEDNKKVVWVTSNDFNKVKISKMKPGKYRENVAIKNHHLNVGVYTISFGITNAMTMETYTKMHSEKSFRVKSTGNELERGIIHVKEEWDIKKLYD
ncbi:MAG TPA: Wzt carbohydrate-binding domain-containing protein, partial [Spirochaetota bacterium]|nr:Wzt carbohydrate-binding domain-containing protein [Spirochaetota bacterium]